MHYLFVILRAHSQSMMITVSLTVNIPTTGTHAKEGQQTVGAFRVARTKGARIEGSTMGSTGEHTSSHRLMSTTSVGGGAGTRSDGDVIGDDGELHYLLVFSSADYKDHSMKSWVLRVTANDFPRERSWWPIETSVVMQTVLDASTCASNIIKR